MGKYLTSILFLFNPLSSRYRNKMQYIKCSNLEYIMYHYLDKFILYDNLTKIICLRLILKHFIFFSKYLHAAKV